MRKSLRKEPPAAFGNTRDTDDASGRRQTRKRGTTTKLPTAARTTAGSKPNRDASKDPMLVELVAQLTWFHQGHPSRRSAHEVVEDMKLRGHALSVQAVLACQGAARDAGIVTHHYHARHERSDVLRLEQALQERFKLKDVKLVPGHPEMLQPLPREQLQAIHHDVTLQLAHAAAAHVKNLLASAAAGPRAGEEFRIGVAGGTSVHLFARAIASLPPGLQPKRIRVLPIVGIVGADQIRPVQANMVASDLAGPLRAVSRQFPCPAIVTREDEAIVKHHQVQAALAAIQDLDLIVTGMGPIEDAADARDIMLSPDDDENARLFNSARAAGASGDICGWWYDRLGREVVTPYRFVGLGLEGLKRHARHEDGRGRQVVLIAGGDQRRIVPLRAALTARFASVLVTDTVTARVLYGEIPHVSGGLSPGDRNTGITAPVSPVAFDPADLARAADPYPLLARLRGAGPVVKLDSGFWAVTGYDAALEALCHRGCGSGPIGLRYLDGLPPGAARDEMSRRINFLDPPDHHRVRSLVSKAFTPRRIADLAPWIAATAERLLDDVAGTGELDLLRRFAHQLPSLVISELLGVPLADRDRLTAWSDAVSPLLGLQVSPADRERAIAAAEEFHAYLSALLDERRRRPGADLLSGLLAAEENGQRLERAELLSLAATLYSAGHRTTRDLFTNGMSVLLTAPEWYRQVVEGHWRVPDVVEEFLRYETPTLFVVRVPLEPVTIGGVDVGAWEPVLVLLSAANRDPAVFTEPDRFRPGRGEKPALSFAYGAHFCLGASLARAEAEAMLAAVTRRWPGLALVAGRPLRWHQRGPFRGLDELVVRTG